MKIFVLVLKILLMIATGAIAIVFNVFGAISTMSTGVAENNDITGYVIFWMSFTIVLFVVPTFLVMLRKYVIAASMSVAGMICIFVLHELIHGAARELYLPMLLITVFDVLIAIFGNWDKIHASIDERERRKNAVAPSVLGGTTAETASEKRSSGKNKRR